MSLLMGLPTRVVLGNGLLAPGAVLRFYQAGSTVPKDVFVPDSGGTYISIGSIVTCTSGGSYVAYLGVGAYRITIEDSEGAQVCPPLDYVTGGNDSGGAIPGSTGSYAIVDNYDALRNLSVDADVVYVQGRTNPGDGGQGSFQRLPNQFLADDGGIILVRSGTTAYKRNGFEAINPVWYGLVYGSATSQNTFMSYAHTASITYGLPVEYTGSTFLGSNFTVPAGSSLKASGSGQFKAGADLQLIFAAGSEFVSGCPQCFGLHVTPVFNTTSVETVKASWFYGASDDEKQIKFQTAGAGHRCVYDVNWTLTGGVNFSAGTRVERDSGLITLSNTQQIILPNLVKQYAKMFSIASVAQLNAFEIGDGYATPEMFGGVGDGVTDDSLAVSLAARSGRMWLSPNKTYAITTGLDGVPSVLSIFGDGTLAFGPGLGITTNALALDGAGIQASGNWCTVSVFTAINSVFPSTYTATTQYISACVYSDGTRNPVTHGQPSIYNAHLPLIQTKPRLATNSVGKIYGTGSWTNRCRNWETSSLIGADGTVNNVKFANGVFFLLANNSTIYTSPTGAYGTWTKRIMPNGGAAQPLLDVCWTGQAWIISGNFTILRSTDLVNWTFQDIGNWLDTGYIRQIASDGNGRVIGTAMGAGNTGTSGSIGLSTDHGQTWVVQYTYNTFSPCSIHYSDGMWVVGLTNTGYLYSTDGATFTLVSVPQDGSLSNNSIYGITKAYGNWIFVGGGFQAVVGNPYSGAYPLFATSFDPTQLVYWDKQYTPAQAYGCMTAVSLVFDTLVATSAAGHICTMSGIDAWTPRFSPFEVTGSAVVGVTDNNTNDPTQIIAIASGYALQCMLELE